VLRVLHRPFVQARCHDVGVSLTLATAAPYRLRAVEAVEAATSPRGVDRILKGSDDEPRLSVFHDLGYQTPPETRPQALLSKFESRN
jgi:arylamine N-acetyltransferase